MKKICILILITIISPFVASASEENEESYQPFIKEGKKWVVTYKTMEGSSSYKRTYIIKGDTIIEGKQYKRFYEGDRFICALREESKKVYAIASTDKFGNPNEEEKIWYDFNVKEGDIIDMGLSYMQVTKTDYIVIEGMRYKRFYMYETDKNLPNANAIGVWVEGVGSYSGPTQYCSWYYDGGVSIMDECYESDQCIFTYDDFGTTKSVDTSIDVLKDYYPTSIPIFDLQGRRLNGKPEKGIYIQNGKKIIK